MRDNWKAGGVLRLTDHAFFQESDTETYNKWREIQPLKKGRVEKPRQFSLWKKREWRK